MKCPRCKGMGVVDVDYEGATETDWEALPKESQLAYRMGLVEFTVEVCSRCNGKGVV